MKRNTLVRSVLMAFAVLTSGCSSCAGDDRPDPQQQQPPPPSPNTQLPKVSSTRRIHSPLGITRIDAASPPAAPDDAGP